MILAGGFLAPRIYYTPLFEKFKDLKFISFLNPLQAMRLLEGKFECINTDIFIGHSIGTYLSLFTEAEKYYLICPLLYPTFPIDFVLKDLAELAVRRIRKNRDKFFVINAIFDPFSLPYFTDAIILTHWSIKSATRIIEKNIKKR